MKRIAIYRYAFPDGTEYIGQTVAPEHRDYLHRRYSSEALKAALRKHPKTEMKIIEWKRKQETADAAENKYIKAAAKPLNIFYNTMARVPHSAGVSTSEHKAKGDFRMKRKTDNRGRRATQRREADNVTCWICKQTKASTEYATDLCRSSGLQSKCKKCANKISTECNKVPKAERSAVYQRVKEELACQQMSQ